MSKGEHKPNPGQHAGEDSKHRYSGATIDAGLLKSGGAWASNAAITDALYIVTNDATGCVVNDAAANPRVANVTDNSYAQSIGGFSYMSVPYGFAQHPPSKPVADTVAAYKAWKAGQQHGPKK